MAKDFFLKQLCFLDFHPADFLAAFARLFHRCPLWLLTRRASCRFISRGFPAAQSRRATPQCRPPRLYLQTLQHLYQRVRHAAHSAAKNTRRHTSFGFDFCDLLQGRRGGFFFELLIFNVTDPLQTASS